MNLACPECDTLYRVDPDRIPAGGVTTRCRECETLFRVDDTLGPTPAGESVVAARAASPTAEREPEEAAEAGGALREPSAAEAESGKAPVFGPQDPDTRARRLARALVSDIKVYHPEKWEASNAAGTLRKDFRDEILKSWEEYVEQVGEEMAKKTPYFRDALNEILARGERVF